MVNLPPNQSLKLTAEAEARQKVEHGGQMVSRGAQENELVVAARRQCETVVRKVR
jgi:hypothetical protein